MEDGFTCQHSSELSMICSPVRPLSVCISHYQLLLVLLPWEPLVRVHGHAHCLKAQKSWWFDSKWMVGIELSGVK